MSGGNVKEEASMTADLSEGLINGEKRHED
jgi:hypothetical protein